MNLKKISIVIPVFNEQESVIETISSVKTAIKRLKYDFEIIVVDDASRDNTHRILDSISGIKCITHIINKGYGASLKHGIKAAGGEWIMILDADGTYPAEKIPDLLAHIGNYDMVVGARIGSHVEIPLIRRPAKRLLTCFASYLANANIIDLNSGFRVFRKEIAEKYWELFPQRFSFTSTLSMICHTKDYDVKYVPINYFKRKGKSSITPLKDFIRFIRLLFKLSIYFNPLQVFVPVSGLLFLLGISWSLYVLLSIQQMPELGLTLILVSIQIFLMGAIAEIISKKR